MNAIGFALEEISIARVALLYAYKNVGYPCNVITNGDPVQQEDQTSLVFLEVLSV